MTAKTTLSAARLSTYTCPMHPDIRQPQPGRCPKCGMALEPAVQAVPAITESTCPMHPEIVRDAPGNRPICGMALEPRTAPVAEDDRELRDMSRRFWLSLALALPVFASAMTHDFLRVALPAALDARAFQWLQCGLTTSVALWGRLGLAGQSVSQTA